MLSSKIIVLDKVIQDLLNTLLNGTFMSLDMDLRLFRCFIRGRDTSEFLDLTSLSLLVESLRITFFNNRERCISIDFNERNLGGFMKSSGRVTICSVRTNKSSNCNNSSISK